MKGPKEYKRWMNRMRKKYGKKNGVIPGALLDMPKYENLVNTSKKNKKVQKF